MGERKVLNKYYPPDFDPAKIPKRKQLKNLQMKVRMMLPMSICCNTCGNFMYKGTKFNCRKEDVVGDTYLGLLKFRFYFKCTKCSAEMIMKTDPKNSDYEMEHGASRNFEPWREADEVKAANKAAREAEEMGDAMKALENRTMDSRMEMDILAGLDEVKSLRSRQANIDQDTLLEALKRSADREHEQAAEPKTEAELDEEDEKLIKSIVFRNSQGFVKRIDDDDEDEEDEDELHEAEASHQRAGVVKPDDIEAPTFTFQKEGYKRKPLVETEEAEGKGKRQMLDSKSMADPGSIAKADTVQVSGLQVKPADTLLTKTVNEKTQNKPIFEVKPVKVAFAVKEKKRSGPASGVVKGGSAQTKAVAGTPLAASASFKAAAPLATSAPASTVAPAAGSGAGGLSLLSGYADSDEGSG